MAAKVQLVACGVLSKLFGLTVRRVQQLAKEGIIPKPKRNQYDLLGCIQAYIKYLQSLATESSEGKKEQARLTKIRADMAQLEFEMKAGRVVVAEEVQDELEKMLTAFRAKLLSLPSDVAPSVAGETEIAGIKIVLDQAVEEAILELRSYDARTGKFKDIGSVRPRAEHAAQPESGNSKPAPKTKSKRVVRKKKKAEQ